MIDGQQLLPQTGQHQQLLSDLALPSSNIQQLPTSQVGLTPFIGGSAGSNIGTITTVTTTLNSTGTSVTISTTSGTSSLATTATTSTSGSPTKSKRSNVDPNRLPLYLDTRLPPGWHRKVSQRKSGASAGRYEVFIIGPTGKRFRSRNEMRAFFDKTNNDSNIDPDDFDFSIFGSNNITSGRAPPKTQPGTLPPVPSLPPPASRNKSSSFTRKVQSSTVASVASPDKVHLPDVIPTSSAGINKTNPTNIGLTNIIGFSGTDPNSSQLQSSLGASMVPNDGTTLPSALSSIVTSSQKTNSNAKGTLVSDIMKNLEKIGMASVDAAKAARAAADQVREGMDSPSGSATSSEILNRLTEPLPQKPLTLPSQPSLEALPNQQRSNLSQLDEQHTNIQPNFQSQLSMETADADAQISQLLETLQKDPNQLVVEGEKIAEFINSLTTGDELDSSSPLPITPTDSNSSQSILQPKPTSNPSQQPSQINKGQVAHHNHSISSIQQNDKSGSIDTAPSNSSAVINKPPELTSGTTGFQASFLNSLASSNNQSEPLKRGASQELDCSNIISSITSPVPPQVSNVLSSGVGASQPLTKTDVMSPNISGSVPPHIATSSPIPLGGTPSLGGAPSQMRAMQNLPQNTRLVRGPNGQYSLQKVHTIELSQEMQASLRIVQAKIQEIEQKAAKTPRDEAELAQLQTKQQQILSTGKPIEGPSGQSFSSQQNVPQSFQQVQLMTDIFLVCFLFSC